MLLALFIYCRLRWIALSFALPPLMDRVSAPNIEDAWAEPAQERFSFSIVPFVDGRIESFLELERAQLPLWLAVAFASGIAAWLWMPGPDQWRAFIVLTLGLAVSGAAFGGRRLGKILAIGGLAMAAGCLLIWLRSELVAAPRVVRPQVIHFDALVETVEHRSASGDLRLTLKPAGSALPPRVRVSLPEDGAPAGLGPGALVNVRARLQPPPPMALPGSHDFARDAWFQGIGGVGRAIRPIKLMKASAGGGLDGLRDRLGRHIRSRLPGSSGGIATALATGDQSAVTEEDAEAMRRSGLAHLLSVSGLHIAAVVGAAMMVSLRLLALSEGLTLRVNLVLVSAGGGAVAGVAYTLLTGMQVPTVRSCIASLLVLAGMALGRDAISLRLVAVAAILVLAFRPETLAGASFQMSFAAVISIIALHQSHFARRWLGPREDGLPIRLLRAFTGLLVTGAVVEFALIPFALYHFHKAGLYSVGANLVAIPLTTFVVMPLQAGAMALDVVGAGAPLWVGTGWAIDLMLALAHRIGSAEGAVAMLPTMPRTAFAAMILGGLWICLWTSRVRWWGAMPIIVGGLAALMVPVPDLLVTREGQHLAVVRADGVPVLLRSRTGDFVRDLMSEASAFDGEPAVMEEQGFARCSRDSCFVDIVKGNRAWRLLAIRSRQRIDWAVLTDACRDADIVVADRRLPRACRPRWLKLDRTALARTGGVAISLGLQPRVTSVADRLGRHAWAD